MKAAVSVSVMLQCDEEQARPGATGLQAGDRAAPGVVWISLGRPPGGGGPYHVEERNGCGRSGEAAALRWVDVRLPGFGLSWPVQRVGGER